MAASRGICAWCGTNPMLRTDGRVRQHNADVRHICPGSDELPETDPIRLAYLDVQLQHRPDQFDFCVVCSPGTDMAGWVKWPCGVWLTAIHNWRDSIPSVRLT